MIKYLLVCFSLMFMVGCSSPPEYITHTEYIVLVPEAVATPAAPSYEPYRINEPLTSEYNFRAFQVNQLQLVDYITLLHRNIRYYEEQIIRLKEKRQQLQSDSSIQSD